MKRKEEEEEDPNSWHGTNKNASVSWGLVKRPFFS